METGRVGGRELFCWWCGRGEGKLYVRNFAEVTLLRMSPPPLISLSRGGASDPLLLKDYSGDAPLNMLNQLIEAGWRIYGSLNWVTFGSDNGLSPIWRQAINWSNVEILLIQTLGTDVDEILSEIHEMHFKMSSRKWRPFWLGLNVLTHLPALSARKHITQ